MDKGKHTFFQSLEGRKGRDGRLQMSFNEDIQIHSTMGEICRSTSS